MQNSQNNEQPEKPVIIDLIKTRLGFKAVKQQQPVEKIDNTMLPKQNNSVYLNFNLEKRKRGRPRRQFPPPYAITSGYNQKDQNEPINMMNNNRLDSNRMKSQIFPFTQFEKKNENGLGNSQFNYLNATSNQNAQQQYPVIIPSCSKWFSMSEVHQIERDQMAEFFLNKQSKTPQIYKKYRNFIINLYRQNTRKYLTATTCRRNLAGDVCAIIRIHQFLEHWGLINFCVDPSTRQKNIFKIREKMSGAKLFKVSNEVVDQLDVMEVENEKVQTDENRLLFNHVKLMSRKYRPYCDYCGLICGVIWYIQKQANIIQETKINSKQKENGIGEKPIGQKQTKTKKPIVLCIKCQSEGNFPTILSEEDFQRVDLLSQINKLQARRSKPWNNQLTLQLLQQIKQHRENWDEIQKAFPNYRKEDLIMKFLQLPLKNITSLKLFNDIKKTSTQKSEEKKNDNDKEPTVFEDFSNPIFQHIAIFKSLLDQFKVKNKENKKQEPQTQNHVNTIKQETVKKEENPEKQSTQIKEEFKESKKIQQIKSDLTYIKKEGKDMILNIEKETKEKAESLRKKKEVEIQQLANQLLDVQLNKIDSKLKYLQEYENSIWNEKKQMQIFQQSLMAEKIQLYSQFRKLNSNQNESSNQPLPLNNFEEAKKINQNYPKAEPVQQVQAQNQQMDIEKESKLEQEPKLFVDHY